MQDFITAVPSDLSETPKTSETGTTSKFLIENDSKTTMLDKLFGEFNYRKECKIVAKVTDTVSSSDRKIFAFLNFDVTISRSEVGQGQNQTQMSGNAMRQRFWCKWFQAKMCQLIFEKLQATVQVTTVAST